MKSALRLAMQGNAGGRPHHRLWRRRQQLHLGLQGGPPPPPPPHYPPPSPLGSDCLRTDYQWGVLSKWHSCVMAFTRWLSQSVAGTAAVSSLLPHPLSSTVSTLHPFPFSRPLVQRKHLRPVLQMKSCGGCYSVGNRSFAGVQPQHRNVAVAGAHGGRGGRRAAAPLWARRLRFGRQVRLRPLAAVLLACRAGSWWPGACFHVRTAVLLCRQCSNRSLFRFFIVQPGP